LKIEKLSDLEERNCLGESDLGRTYGREHNLGVKGSDERGISEVVSFR